MGIPIPEYSTVRQPSYGKQSRPSDPNNRESTSIGTALQPEAKKKLETFTENPPERAPAPMSLYPIFCFFLASLSPKTTGMVKSMIFLFDGALSFQSLFFLSPSDLTSQGPFRSRRSPHGHREYRYRSYFFHFSELEKKNKT